MMKRILTICLLFFGLLGYCQQYARPTSDITTGGNINGSSADLDETSSNDSDYVTGDDNSSGANPGDIHEVALTAVTDPEVGTGHIIRFRESTADTGVAPATQNGSNPGQIQVELYQGTTLIATVFSQANTTDNAWSTQSYTLSTTEANNITDYTDLRLRFTYWGSGGGNPNSRRGAACSWAEMQVPDAPVGGNRRVIIIN